MPRTSRAPARARRLALSSDRPSRPWSRPSATTATGPWPGAAQERRARARIVSSAVWSIQLSSPRASRACA
eukprot:11209875-Lingulodinium_polyedra.AAC.1